MPVILCIAWQIRRVGVEVSIFRRFGGQWLWRPSYWLASLHATSF